MAGDEIVELGDNSAQQLAGIIERIEGLEVEKVQAAAKIAAEKKLAQSNGFDIKAINQLLKDRRGDTDKTTEARAVTKSYLQALAKLPGTIGEWAAMFDAAQNTAQQRRPAARLKTDEGGKGGKFN